MFSLIENPYLDVDRKIVAEVYTSSELMDNMETLCDIYGSRWPGTPEDIGAVRWMVEKLRGYGVDNPHFETFKIPGWVRGPARLEVTSPVRREIECISLPHTIGGEVEARLVSLGDGPVDIYEKRRGEVEGSVVMVTSRNPPGMTRRLHRSEKYMRSVLAGARGWIFVNHQRAAGPPTGTVNPIIPSVGVSYEDGGLLERLLRRFGEVRVRLETTDRNLEVETHNVICDMPGSSGDREYVLAGSHYDAHDIAQGAMDPTSGTVTVLEMARVLNMVRDRLKRRVRLVLFGAEEIGLYGSFRYAEMHEEELGELRFMLNLDSAGTSTPKKGIVFAGHPELEPFIRRAAMEMRTELLHGQDISLYGDIYPFFVRGVPCGARTFGDPGVVYESAYGHSRFDTVDKVELEYLRLSAANYARLLLRIANADDWPARRKTPDEVEEFIRRKGYADTVELTRGVKEHVRSWASIHPETREWLDRGERDVYTVG